MSSEARTVSASNVGEVAVWCGGKIVGEIDPFDDTASTPAINVQTGDKVSRAYIGDTIIKNHDGTYQIFKGQ